MIGISDDIIEQIIIIMIKNKQYADLNNCKQIPRLNKLINNNKKYYLMNIGKNANAVSSVVDATEVRDLTRYLSLNGILMNQPLAFNIRALADMADWFIISGKNIRKVEIIICGQVTFRYHYINAGLIRITPLPEGLHLPLFEEIYVKVYADYIDKFYIKLIRITESYRNYRRSHHIFSSEFPITSGLWDISRLTNTLVYYEGRCAFRYAY
jgi:hypothetical protein